MPVYNFEQKNNKNFPLIPTGIYDAVIENIEEKTARSGNKYKHITFRILGERAEEKKVAGRLIWDNIVLLKQVEWKIQGLLYACGMPYEGEVKLSDDWKELIGKKLKISIGTRDFNGTEQNEVKNFYPLGTRIISKTEKSENENSNNTPDKNDDDDIPVIEEEETSKPVIEEEETSKPVIEEEETSKPEGEIDPKDIPF